MSWFKFEISENEVAWGNKWEVMQDKFTSIYMSHVAPEDAALFSQSKEEGGEIFYFSPEAARIAKSLLIEFNAIPCPPPIDSGDWYTGVALLVGASDARERLLGQNNDGVGH